MSIKGVICQVVDDTFSHLVGVRLREARAALGLNQDELADAAGVTRVQWGRYERGIAVPGGEVLAGAAKAGVDVRYVITGNRDYSPPEPLTAEEKTLLIYWRQASGETRKAALGALVGATADKGARVVIHGKVGSQLIGDQTIHGNVTLGGIGKRKR